MKHELTNLFDIDDGLLSANIVFQFVRPSSSDQLSLSSETFDREASFLDATAAQFRGRDFNKATSATAALSSVNHPSQNASSLVATLTNHHLHVTH